MLKLREKEEIMATYTGRNRKRLQRDLRKGKVRGTDAIMEAYGNKRQQQIQEILVKK